MIFLHPALADGAYSVNVPAETAQAQPSDRALRPPVADPAWATVAQAAGDTGMQGGTGTPGGQTADKPAGGTNSGGDITIPYVPDTSGAGTPGSMDNSGTQAKPQSSPGTTSPSNPANTSPYPSPGSSPSSNPSTNPGGDTNNPGSPH
jgi:hypothetical protein